MGDDLDLLKIGDVLDQVIDNRGKTPPNQEMDTPYGLIEVNALRGDSKRPIYSEIRKFVLKETYDTWFRKGHPQKGDVLFSTVGSIAEVALSEGVGCIAQNVIALRPKGGVLDGDFLYYALKNPVVKNQLLSLDISSVQPSIKVPHLLNVELLWPSIVQQRKIAGILSSLDDKIELNRQINATLESMAQALFKSWFVDFDPVIDNALAAGNPIPEPLQARAEKRAALLAAASAADTRSASATDNAHPTQTAPHTQPGTTAPATPVQPLPADLRALFPNSFVFNEEMGWVPEGWEVSSLDSLIELIGGGTPKTSNEEYWNGDIPWFSVVDAPSKSDVFVLDTEKHVTPNGIANSSAKLLPVGTTIISARGTVGKCAVVGEPMAMNQSCYGVRGAEGYGDYFTYYTVLLRVAELQQRSHGSVFSTITRDTFRTIKIAACPPGVSCAFDDLVSVFMSKIKLNVQSNKVLSELRDALLPKLLSGKIQLPEAESLAAEAL